MTATLPEDLEDEVGGAVEHLRLLLEPGGGAHEAAELDELLHPVERTGVLANQRHDIEGANLGCPGPILDTDIRPDNATELHLPVPRGNHARGVEQLADLLDGNIGRQWTGRLGELETEGPQRRLSRVQVKNSARTGSEQSKRPPRPGFDRPLPRG